MLRVLGCLLLVLPMLAAAARRAGTAQRGLFPRLPRGLLLNAAASVSTPAAAAAGAAAGAAATTAGLSGDDKLRLMRELMAKEQIDAFIVPTDDPHMSEYTAPYFGRREFISGFTGSAGTALVLRDKALLFTDGRYHNQAEIELKGSQWTLMKQGLKDVPGLVEYLSTNLPPGAVVGFDPLLHAAFPLKKMQDTLEGKKLGMKPVSYNLIDRVWGDSRPAAPRGEIRIHPVEYAGKTVKEKLEDIRKSLKSAKAVGLVLTALDEIAWTFNIRGADVPCNPVSVAYATISANGGAELFIDAEKVPQQVAVALESAGVTLRAYDEALSAVAQLDKAAADAKSLVWLDGKTANTAVCEAVHASRRIDKECPVTLMKACKNEAELAGMRACHIRDGAAMAEFFAWLEYELGSRTISEVELDEKVCSFRESFGKWLEPSFPTIAGVNSNGAIVHYRAVKETCKILGNNDMCLLDSGGQYLDGTTDVTRTFHTGTPTAHQKEMFTRVLKGHIGLDSRVFPAGTAGCYLDAFAREHLWAIGKDYIHGTGHGVGAALNVHEGPHRISRVLDPHPLLVGNVVSNEPGYYEDSNFGIRIENLLVVVPRPDVPEFGGRAFLGFERLTHIPIQHKLIDTHLLTAGEVSWLDKYHRQIFDKVYPLLRTDGARAWLKEATKSLAIDGA